MIELSEALPASLLPQIVEYNLRRIAHLNKAQQHFLEAVRLHLAADGACLYTGGWVDGGSVVRLDDGDASQVEEAAALAFARQERPDLPRHVLLAPVRVFGRLMAVVGAVRRGRDFELGTGRTLNEFAGLLASDWARREVERTDRYVKKITEKIISELRPRDLAYQILDGLHRLVSYDHSAAMLTWDAEAGVFRVDAEKVVWRKSKSAFIGHEFPVSEEVVAALCKEPTSRVLADSDERAGPYSVRLREALGYAHGEGIPPETSTLCVPLMFGGELLGLLKLSTWRRFAFDGRDVHVVERFRRAAAVAVRNARVRVSLEDRALKAEVRAGLVTLARAVNHDVNNAIGSILPLVQQMGDELRAGRMDPETMARDLDMVVEKVRLCSRIFGNMLRVAGSGRTGAGPLDLNRIVRETVAFFAGQLERAGIELQLDLRDVPPVRASHNHLEHIVVSLVTNSIEALARAGSRIEVATCRGPESGWVHLVVEDDGPGMDAELQRKVQEPFFTTKSGGTGLGLPISRALAWQVGGNLTIESEVGAGTRVTVGLREDSR